MKKILVPAITALVFFAVSCNDEKKTDESTAVTTEQTEVKTDSLNAGNDAAFALAVADGGMLEVKLGQLAQTNGSTAKVKELGKMMETDHSKGNDELIVWAMKNNVQLPSTLSTEKQEKYNALASKKGTDFDKAYTELMIESHTKNLTVFKKEADEGTNGELKSWAAGKLPVLEHHLEMAKSANDAVKK